MVVNSSRFRSVQWAKLFGSVYVPLPHCEARGTSRPASRTLTFWLLLGAFYALPLPAAQAACAQWAIKDALAIHQKNDFWVTFYAKQTGTDFHGLAESSDDVTGLLDGHIEGDEFEATVTWAGGSIGVYKGTVFENGYLGGITHDEAHPESSTSWRSLYNLDCLTTAGTQEEWEGRIWIHSSCNCRPLK